MISTRDKMARKSITSLSERRKRKNNLSHSLFVASLSWKSSSIKETIETIIKSHGMGRLKPKIPEIKKVKTSPKIRFGLLTFFDRATPMIMPRIMDEEVGLSEISRPKEKAAMAAKKY